MSFETSALTSVHELCCIEEVGNDRVEIETEL